MQLPLTKTGGRCASKPMIGWAKVPSSNKELNRNVKRLKRANDKNEGFYRMEVPQIPSRKHVFLTPDSARKSQQVDRVELWVFSAKQHACGLTIDDITLTV